MDELPKIPESIRGATTLVRRDNGDLVITCRLKHPLQHKQISFINGLLGPDEPIALAGLDTTRRYSVLSEIFGNMVRHHADETPPRTVEIVIRPDGGTTVTSRGYVNDYTRERMGTKFQVAQSLDQQQAQDRLNRIIDSATFEHHKDAFGEESGGMGLLIQRAYSEGDMKLTFYPDDYYTKGRAKCERFELEVELTRGRGVPAPQADAIEHKGPLRSFFPHVVRTT